MFVRAIERVWQQQALATADGAASRAERRERVTQENHHSLRSPIQLSLTHVHPSHTPHRCWLTRCSSVSSAARSRFSSIRPERQGNVSLILARPGKQMAQAAAGGLSPFPASQGHTRFPVGCQMRLRWLQSYASFIVRASVPADLRRGGSTALWFWWLELNLWRAEPLRNKRCFHNDAILCFPTLILEAHQHYRCLPYLTRSFKV